MTETTTASPAAALMPAWTRLLTKDGNLEIQTLEGMIVDVWDGADWVAASVRKVDTAAAILRLHLYPLNYIDCADTTLFKVLGNNKPVAAWQLKGGDRIRSHSGPDGSYREEIQVVARSHYSSPVSPMYELVGTTAQLAIFSGVPVVVGS